MHLMTERAIATVINIPGVGTSTNTAALADTSAYVQVVAGEGTKLHGTSRAQFYLHGADRAPTARSPGPTLVATSLLAQTVHNCFDTHTPISFAPEVIWHTVAVALAETVRRDPETYRHLFTASSEKELVRVIDDSLIYGNPGNDWGSTIRLFNEALGKCVPDGTMEKMLPSFSTSTPEAKAGSLVAFMDAASPFYEYRVMTRCGVPSVRLEGTPEDWRRVLTSAAALSEVVPALAPYWNNLLPVLTKFEAAARGESDVAFWKDMYKIKETSGDEHVTGWFANFFTYIHDTEGFSNASGELRMKTTAEFDYKNLTTGWNSGPKMRRSSFPSQVSTADFIWEYLGREIPGMQFMGGVLGVDLDDGFMAPRMGYAIIEAAK